MTRTATTPRSGLGESHRAAAPDFGGAYGDLGVESVVLAYLVNERPSGETIPELSRRFSPSNEGDLVERAIRELIRARLLCIEQGKVVPDRAAIAGGSE